MNISLASFKLWLHRKPPKHRTRNRYLIYFEASQDKIQLPTLSALFEDKIFNSHIVVSSLIKIKAATEIMVTCFKSLKWKVELPLENKLGISREKSKTRPAIK